MNSPQFLQQMSSLMSNPAILDQIIASNPHLAPIAPQVREVFQSEQFRQMMSAALLSRVHTNAYVHTCIFRSNPESLRTVLQMSSMLGERGGGGPFNNPFGGLGALGGAAANSFPAPGVPSTGTPTAPTSTIPGQQQQQSPQNQSGPSPTGGAGIAAPMSPLGGAGLPPSSLFDPALLQQMQAMFGSQGGFGGLPFGAGAGATATPADTRPPEERSQLQLQVRRFCLLA